MDRQKSEIIALDEAQMMRMGWAVVILFVTLVVILSGLQSMAGVGMDMLVKEVMTYCCWVAVGI